MAHPYTTLAAIERKLPQCRERWGDGNVPAEAAITELIEENDCLIDGYCADRYETPFDTVPTVIARIALDLAVADIREIMYPDMPEIADALGPARRKRAMEALEAIAAGKLALEPGGADEADTTVGDYGRPEGSWASTDEPTFTLEDEW